MEAPYLSGLKNHEIAFSDWYSELLYFLMLLSNPLCFSACYCTLYCPYGCEYLGMVMGCVQN